MKGSNIAVSLKRLNDSIYLTHGPGWWIGKEGKGNSFRFVLNHFGRRVRSIGHSAAIADEVLLDRTLLGKGRKAASRCQ
jgi:hypothetical protein